MRRDIMAVALLAVAMMHSSAMAAPKSGAEEPVDALQAALAKYRAKDQRLQDIGWRLITGNAPFCSETRRSIGLQLLDTAGFGSPEAVRKALGLHSDFVVQTVATRSPAKQAGLQPGQPLRSIDGAMPDNWSAQESDDWERLKRAHDLIDASLAADGKVKIALKTGEPMAIRGQEVCTTRFELETGSDRAVAEGQRVVIGERFVGLGYSDEEFAAAIAHELAHNLLAHRAWLAAKGRKRRNIRLTEKEADRLMPWILANGGYDPAAALRFMKKWGPRHAGGIFRKRTHDGWDERAEFIQAELPELALLLRREGVADWSRHFRRETGP